MSKRVSATDARIHFGEILRAVQEGGDTVIVERGGRAAAVIVPVAAYERMTGSAASRSALARIAALHRLWKTGLDAGRISDAAAAIHEGRAERDAQLDEILRR